MTWVLLAAKHADTIMVNAVHKTANAFLEKLLLSNPIVEDIPLSIVTVCLPWSSAKGITHEKVTN